MRPRRKTIALLCLVLLSCALVAWRAAAVTAAAGVPPVEEHAQGEWVEMRGAYYLDTYEKGGDYAFRVLETEIMSPNEYIRRYAKDGAEPLTEPRADEPTLVVLKMTVRNDGTDVGGVDAYMWELVSEAGNRGHRFDPWLFAHAEPSVENGSFAVKPGSEYTTYMPFTGKEDGDAFDPRYTERRLLVTSKSFRLAFSNYPVRKTVALSAS